LIGTKIPSPGGYADGMSWKGFKKGVDELLRPYGHDRSPEDIERGRCRGDRNSMLGFALNVIETPPREPGAPTKPKHDKPG
jgi:hypothetical protein